ncbi:hypothetical protein H6504_01360 [Candidatus Woesearchaeota archaeon]|nr:hypothetical protein [Candidatus Woesearchaeota archaeon]
MNYISKSNFKDGLACKKLFWYEINEPESIPNTDFSTIAAQGTQVGELARTLYPEGLLVNSPKEEALLHTQQMLLNKKPLFEAAFAFEDLFCKVDILNPLDDGTWELIEVKMGTSMRMTILTI